MEDGLQEFGYLNHLRNKNLLTDEPKKFSYISENVPADTNQEIFEELTAKEALGALHVNCSGCHSPEGSMAALGIDFSYNLEANDPTESNAYITGVSRGVIVPGDADSSRLYQRMLSGSMPVGNPMQDSSEIDRIKVWIDALEPIQ